MIHPPFSLGPTAREIHNKLRSWCNLQRVLLLNFSLAGMLSTAANNQQVPGRSSLPNEWVRIDLWDCSGPEVTIEALYSRYLFSSLLGDLPGSCLLETLPSLTHL